MQKHYLSAVVVALAAFASSQTAHAGGPYTQIRSDDLFYNYYTFPSTADGQTAQLYISPRPAPPLVGHTYITYQPLMPHEFMYGHARTYWSHHPQGGLTRTRVSYRWSPWGQSKPHMAPHLPIPQGVSPNPPRLRY